MTTVINLTLDVVLGYLFGLVGIAAATTITSIVLFVAQGRRLSKLEPELSLMVVWRRVVRSSLAILPSVVVFGLPIWAGLAGDELVVRVVVLVAAGVAGLTLYYRLARRLGLEEAHAITAFGVNTVRRVYSRSLRRIRPGGHGSRS